LLRFAAELALSCLLAGGVWAETFAASENVSPELWVTLPESSTQAAGAFRLDWGYDFQRGNRADRVFNADQTQTGTRRNRRKTHLVDWQVKYGLTDRLQLETDLLYQAYRQHTHSDGDEHDRNDDGDFDQIFTGMSWKLLRESASRPALRVRGGLRWPNRAENEGIGQEFGVDWLAVAGKQFGAIRVTGSVGVTVTFDNHDQPADPIFQTTPFSKGHDLRTLAYGLGLSRALDERWQLSLELAGRTFDTIELNRRMQESALALTPGLFYRGRLRHADIWVGIGVPIGLTHDTDHIGVSIQTGLRF